MSAYLDSYSGAGYDGSDSGGVGDVGTRTDGERPFSESAFVQQAGAVAFGYLSRRLDVDLSRRLQGTMPQPNQRGTAPFVRMGGQGVPQPGRPEPGAAVGFENLLLLGAAAAAALFISAG